MIVTGAYVLQLANFCRGRATSLYQIPVKVSPMWRCPLIHARLIAQPAEDEREYPACALLCPMRATQSEIVEWKIRCRWACNVLSQALSWKDKVQESPTM